MFLDSVGIILRKSSSSNNKIVILDKIQGKIECITNTPSFSTGSLITYNIGQQRSIPFINDSTLIYMPLSLAQIDILFFHHVLELIYYFSPMGSCAKEVFDLLAFLYATSLNTITNQFKKLFLLKLLTSMGSIPEHNETRTPSITQLNSMNIRQLHAITINATHEKELDRWLWYCVWQHPYVNEFKTVHFLSRNRTL